MEFKKPTSYKEGRPKLNVPERGGSTRIIPQPSSRTILKTAAVSFIYRFVHSKKAIIITIIILIGGSLLIWLAIRQHEINVNSRAKGPEYQTVLPGTKPISELGGWRRISPPQKDPVFAYADTIGDIPISISQQPLPASFQSDVNGQVAEMAKKFNATTKIDAAGTKVYVGTSVKGPQSAILTKNGLLILIKSQSKVDDVAWAEYVKSLN
ncbi:MAG: hypothetical protein ABWX90_02645 [Candidatus Saccharimonadales bacterium]